MAAADRFILDRLTLREGQLHQTEDAIEAKASILLVALTFIAGQSALFLHSYPKTGFVHWEQVVAVVFEVICGILLALILKVGVFPGENVKQFPGWRDDIQKDDPTLNDADVEAAMISGLVLRVTNRVTQLYESNEKKATILNFAYWASLLALLLNFIVLSTLIR